MPVFAKTILFIVVLSGQTVMHTDTTEASQQYITSARSDFNGDGLMDRVTVSMQLSEEGNPYTLRIYLGRKEGADTLFLETSEAIESRETVTNYGGDPFSKENLQVNGNKITLSQDLLRGHYHHIFRFQQGDFYLTGYSETGVISPASGTYGTTEVNLLTGKCLLTKAYIYKNTNSQVIHKHKKISPLPKLRDFSRDTDTLFIF